MKYSNGLQYIHLQYFNWGYTYFVEFFAAQKSNSFLCEPGTGHFGTLSKLR